MTFVVSSGALVATDRPMAPPWSRSVQVSAQLSLSYSELYRTQANVRTVISFLARNIAHLGLHLYQRVSDTDRQRVTDHPLAALIGKPNPWTTRYRMMVALVSDLGIYDTAFLLKVLDARTPAIIRLNPQKVVPEGDNVLVPTGYTYHGTRGRRTFPADQVIAIHGYNPDDDRTGCSPLESLRRMLSEEYSAGEYRDLVLRNGGRFSGYLSRPADAPQWDATARSQFKADWQSQYSGLGPGAGGTPLLEDGMTWVAAGQTAEQLEYVSSRKLTREEVAAAYHIPGPLIGILDHATFSNISEQHKHLYQDTLGPQLRQIEEEFGLQLVPDLAGSDASLYLEFNLAEKLKGSFEEQAQQLQASVGAPWVTRNEARARQNLPAIDGGDELVTPLNVLIGGQASPIDSGDQNLGASRTYLPGTGKALVFEGERIIPGRLLKAHYDRKPYETAVADLMRRFFSRQRVAVLARLGKARGKTPDWWDDERWNSELAGDLYELAVQVSHSVARSVLEGIELAPDAYDVDRTKAFLRAVAERVAGGINTVTRDQLDQALRSEDAAADVPAVFDQAGSSRSVAIAGTLVTTLAGFATVEAGRQTSSDSTKTWITGHNARPSHAKLNGETVPVSGRFSNGADWPGDSSVLTVDDIAGCNCSVSITVP